MISLSIEQGTDERNTTTILGMKGSLNEHQLDGRCNYVLCHVIHSQMMVLAARAGVRSDQSCFYLEKWMSQHLCQLKTLFDWSVPHPNLCQLNCLIGQCLIQAVFSNQILLYSSERLVKSNIAPMADCEFFGHTSNSMVGNV